MRITTFRSLCLGSLIALAGACSSSKTSAPTSTPKSTVVSGDTSCPVSVPGTSVTVEDANNGAAFAFVTTGDVAELRKRVGEMAKMHNDHHASMGALPDGKNEHAGHDMGGHAGHDMGSGGGHAGHDMGSGGGHAGHDMKGHAGHAGGMIGVHSKATASDIEGGAKLLFVSGGGDVAKLQGELRMHAQHMSTGTCTMGKS
ncbi:MAG: hypothetical protein H0V17_10970 [Deltaproteobacteria bacterium]|nr:hypothetical protein [Deltaproteobacteria bacterium]